MTIPLLGQGFLQRFSPSNFILFSVSTATVMWGFGATAIEPSPNSRASSSSTSAEQVLEQLPPEMLSTLFVCRDQGGVDLAAGTNPEGLVICADGSSAPVPYSQYLSTTSDFMTAGMLMGIRLAIDTDPRITPGLFMTVFATSEGTTAIRGAAENAIVQSRMLTDDPASVALLTDEVMNRILPTFQATNHLETLFGTQEQYEIVVQNFCSDPGWTLEQAQQLVPGLMPIQLYAICMQASGAVNPAQQ
jgi:hypothetical protein